MIGKTFRAAALRKRYCPVFVLSSTKSLRVQKRWAKQSLYYKLPIREFATLLIC